MSEFFVPGAPLSRSLSRFLMTLIGGVCISGVADRSISAKSPPPEIQVQTHFTGADALTIEQSVAAPIEQQMSGVDNMNYMYSINSNSGDIRLIVNFRRCNRPEHRSRADADPGLASAIRNLPADVINYGA